MKTIVVGFDGSPAAERALERAVELSDGEGRIVIVTARITIPPASAVDEPILDSPSAEERDSLLDRAAATVSSRGIQPILVPADAGPAEALVEAARAEDAQLIVVGGTGSGYVTRALLGSTAEQVVRRAPCDVLVVR